MKKYFSAILIAVFAVSAIAQKTEKPKKSDTKNDAAVKPAPVEQTPLELAKAAVTAHGGDKFKNMKTLVVRGTASISGSPTATFPATFAMIISGEKYRLDVSNPIQPFKQVFDGERTQSSIEYYTSADQSSGLAAFAKSGNRRLYRFSSARKIQK